MRYVFCFFAGAVYLIYHKLLIKSIEWNNFNLAGHEGDILQIGLVLFFLQVSQRKTENKHLW